jgi:hypothetical protein
MQRCLLSLWRSVTFDQCVYAATCSFGSTMFEPQCSRGALIVFEGCDRAGKSTQCRKLVQILNERNIKAEYMGFPGKCSRICWTRSRNKVYNFHIELNESEYAVSCKFRGTFFISRISAPFQHFNWLSVITQNSSLEYDCMYLVLNYMFYTIAIHNVNSLNLTFPHDLLLNLGFI